MPSLLSLIVRQRSTDYAVELHMTEKGRQTPELTRGRWWKLPLTFVGLLLTTVGALGCLTLITATDEAENFILSIPAQRAWLIAILGGAVGGLARALYQFLVDNYAFHYLRITKRSSPWAMRAYGLKDDKDMEDDYDPLESWQLFFVKPLIGATLGLLFALALDLGLLGLGGDIAGAEDKRFMRLVVTAGLAGLFAENVLQRLEGLLTKPG
jgi:hypothetical protein